jgi:hypothetical protein
MRSAKHLLPFLTLLPMMATAQEPTSQYEIQGVYSPTLMEARKLDMRPQPIDTILPPVPVSYTVLPAKGEVPARVDSIAAARLSVEQANQRLYRGYAKAGFGLYTTPLAEIYLDQVRSKDNSWGLHYKHLSSNGGLKDVGPSDYSFNNVDAFYTHFMPRHEVGARLMYDRRRISYYGHPENDSIRHVLDAIEAPDEFLKQIYNDIGFAGRLRSLYGDSSKIAHDVGLEVHSYGHLNKSRETNVRLTAELSKQEGAEVYAAGLLVDNNAYRGFLDNDLGDFRQNGTLLGLTPNVSTRGDKYLVRVGAGIYLDAMGRSTFHFYPQAYLSYDLFDKILIPYLGVDGAKQRNSFRSLTRQNPWLNGAPSLANTSKNYDVYGGLRGSFSSDLGFDVRISRSRMKDMALFVNQPNDPFGDRMAVIYDRVDILNLSGELHYHYREQLQVNARIDVSTYELEFQDEAWNLPPYQLTLGATYDIRDKLILKTELLFMGQRKARRLETVEVDNVAVPAPVTVDLDGFLDLYLGVEYRYTKRLSLFLDMSNLSASKYERWYRHPVQRGLVLGGATYAF